ncbi:hypothetical protein [Marinobacter gelidimuriae]|uniref:hypothetical protein n=1 Tax=Marinobacter gelidimuriae TaxID=2739064 RepID=UPI0012DD5AC5|nr:hypothetical protein [Marinobacter gelidimuriae]
MMRRRYLRPSLGLPEIYLYRAPIDFRKQANGLALLIVKDDVGFAAPLNLAAGADALG